MESCLNKNLEGINDYFKANKLKLNANKTKMVCFSKKCQTTSLENINIYLDGVKLKFDDEASFLGITVDSKLKWDSHCNKVANKISKNSSAINRVKKMLPPESLKTLYNSLILPHIQYGLVLWGKCTGPNKNRIHAIQKRIVRTVSKSYFTSHTEPRMKKLKILKIEDLYKLQCDTLVYDCLNNLAPKGICSLVALKTDKNDYSLRATIQNPLDINKANYNSKQGKCSFKAQAPDHWNSLPGSIRELDKRNSFKNQAKKLILTEYALNVHCSNPLCRDRRHHLGV
jgi:hypothetical protein